jgi:hypothetical protein
MWPPGIGWVVRSAVALFVFAGWITYIERAARRYAHHQYHDQRYYFDGLADVCFLYDSRHRSPFARMERFVFDFASTLTPNTALELRRITRYDLADEP